MAVTREFTPNIPTGDRPVLPGGHRAGLLAWWLYLIPAMGVFIAVADDRLGFRLLMGSLACAMLALVVGLQLRMRALRPGMVRIAASGELHFLPPRTLWFALIAVPVAFLVPAIAIVVIAVFDLPTQASSSRLAVLLPFVLWAFSLGSLAQLAWGRRRQPGLRVGPAGLQGVRGSALVDLTWGELAAVSVVGAKGPKLSLITLDGNMVVIDAHFAGSDPAVVAAVIEFFRTRPNRRTELANGSAAIRAVETIGR